MMLEGHIYRAFEIIFVQKIANLMNNSKIMSKALTSMLYIYPVGCTIYTFGVGYCYLSSCGCLAIPLNG